MITDIVLLCVAIAISCFLLIVVKMYREEPINHAELFFLAVVGLTACICGMDILADVPGTDEYCLAYTLNEQYVGDINVNGVQYNDILLMNVTPQKYAYGSSKLHIDKSIFGQLQIYDSKYLGETDHHHKLYFAGENQTLDRLYNDKTIVCRWVEIAPCDCSIKGVWGINEVGFK